MAGQGDADRRGAVFTRKEVVEFILDLVGYCEDQPLHRMRLLEPSFGGGDFLFPAVERLLKVWRASPHPTDACASLRNAIRGVELHRDFFDATRQTLVERITAEGIGSRTAATIADHWLTQGDFLLSPPAGLFDVVVGNPPYVRQELIPSPLLSEYRSRYHTMYDRADLYIPFIERSLLSLAEKGRLGFICSDRWMKNRYGGPLRAFVSSHFALKIYVDMVDTAAFQREVVAYPAITVIAREQGVGGRIAHRPRIDPVELGELARKLRAPDVPERDPDVRELPRIAAGDEPWLLQAPDQTALLRRLERQFPTVEEAGCGIGIGVATGADKVFIADFAALDVEPDRKLPLAMTRDISSGEVRWRGLGVINPFADNGRLVDLAAYPRLERYLLAHREAVSRRHCARKSPRNWYRTIDRITPALARTPKLLIPDIKGEAHVVFEPGGLYPHHNLYYVTSGAWDIRALQAVLLSCVARLFVATYSTRMRGGYLRFQAQYLRRIRIPFWRDVPSTLRETLADAAVRRDLSACDAAVFELYGMNAEERSALGEKGG